MELIETRVINYQVPPSDDPSIKQGSHHQTSKILWLNRISWGYHWDMIDWLVVVRNPSKKSWSESQLG
jgi:hypothetical protein